MLYHDMFTNYQPNDIPTYPALTREAQDLVGLGWWNREPMGLDPYLNSIAVDPSLDPHARRRAKPDQPDFQVRQQIVGERVSIAGLGQEAQPLNLVQMVRDTHSTVKSVQPLATFVGEHPVLSVAALMIAIIGGAAIGGSIGASGSVIRQQRRK